MDNEQRESRENYGTTSDTEPAREKATTPTPSDGQWTTVIGRKNKTTNKNNIRNKQPAHIIKKKKKLKI